MDRAFAMRRRAELLSRGVVQQCADEANPSPGHWQRGALKPTTGVSSLLRMFVTAVFPLALMACSTSAPDAGTVPSLATAPTAGRNTHHEVADRARALLTSVGVRQLLAEPGYESESNAAFTGLWGAHRVVVYVSPTSALPSTSELVVTGKRKINGKAVDVVRGEDNTNRMLRFALETDTWMVASPESPPVAVALAKALLVSQ